MYGTPLYFSGFSEIWIFLNRLSKNIQMSNFIHVLPAGDEFFRAARRTDRRAVGRADRHEEANSCFSQLCELA